MTQINRSQKYYVSRRRLSRIGIGLHEFAQYWHSDSTQLKTGTEWDLRMSKHIYIGKPHNFKSLFLGDWSRRQREADPSDGELSIAPPGYVGLNIT